MSDIDNTLYIQSSKNERIKAVVESQSRRGRERTGVFFFEGFRETQRADGANICFHSIYFCTDYWRDMELSLQFLGQLQVKGILTIRVSQAVFDKVSMREGPDGWAALAYPWDMHLNRLCLNAKKSPLILACEALEKPGNLGAIMRSAEAGGVDALLICDSLIDVLSPSVIRNSQGAIFTLPIFMGFNEEVYQYLIAHHFRIIASTPHAQAMYWDISLRDPVAILMGNEHTGLSNFWLEKAHQTVKIPLYGASDSLNVGVASVLMIYEALRQRHSSL